MILPYAAKIGFALAFGALLHGWLWLYPLPKEAADHSALRSLSSR